MDWDIVTRYVIPPVLGGLGGLIATFANWGIEKRRQRLLRKRELVTGWRMELLPLIGQPHDPAHVWAGERQRIVMSSPYYASLRPHLSKEAIEQIENPIIHIVLPPKGAQSSHWGHHYPLKLFVEEIARIEKEWKLI